MELINKQIIESYHFGVISTVLKVHYENRHSTSAIISYDEFKATIKSFINQIMKTYLENTENYKNDKYSCSIQSCSINGIKLNTLGTYNSHNNKIIINESVVYNIYNGNIIDFRHIFHELNHFRIWYELKQGKINVDLIRIAKEALLRFYENTGIVKKFINKEDIPNRYYYKCNYHLYSEEKVVNIAAINDLLNFLELSGIELSNEDSEYLKKEQTLDKQQYQNCLRDFRYNFNFNDYFLDFEDAFDFMIKYNPKWVECPQLEIEFYLDKNGNIKKKTIEELKEDLSKESNAEKIQVLQEIINFKENKTLNKNDFPDEKNKFKIEKNHLEDEISNNYKK